MSTDAVAPPFDPSSRAALRAEIRRMRGRPTGVERPIVILAGWRSPGLGWVLGRRLRSLTGASPADITAFAYPFTGDIVPVARRVARLTSAAFPAGDGPGGAPVDVVAVSMGGLVARAAASTLVDPPRLNIHRLFTLGTPHRGARLAARIRVDRASRDMRPGSAFLARLDAERAGASFEIIPYAALDDWMVGASNTAPPGSDPVWFKGLPLISHHAISANTRILLDLARRLRGEAPIAEPSRPPRD